jgi:hypothetical protein
MSQILHIFRKDVRQFWREIALSLGLLAAFTSYEPGEWVPNPDPAMWQRFLAPLLLFGWGVLIVRDIQAEVLVGDRQFWVTRPYEWKKLLAAKILFVLVMFNLPLLMADSILLGRAGFASLLYVPGLLWLQLFLTVLLVLPVVTLGTITSNVGQAVLVVLGVVLYFIANLVLSSATHKSHWRVVASLPSWLPPIALIGTFIVVIAFQYARRKTVLARGLLVGLAIIGLLATVGISSPPRPPWIPDAREYPYLVGGEQPPVQLAFDPTKTVRPEPGFRREKKVQVRIPLQASGQTKDSLVRTDGTMVTIDAGGGLQWSSAWQPGSGPFLFPGQEHSQVDFTVDKDFFERAKSLPVAVQFSFVMTVFRPKDKRRVFITSEDFAVPRVGFCWTKSATNTVGCRYPLRVPAYVMISTAAKETTCTVSDEERPHLVGTSLYGWTRESGYETSHVFVSGPQPETSLGLWYPPELGLSPVGLVRLELRPPEGEWGPRQGNEWPLLCPGTPLVFSYLNGVQRLRLELNIGGLQLADYELSGRQFSRQLDYMK